MNIFLFNEPLIGIRPKCTLLSSKGIFRAKISTQSQFQHIINHMSPNVKFHRKHDIMLQAIYNSALKLMYKSPVKYTFDSYVMTTIMTTFFVCDASCVITLTFNFYCISVSIVKQLLVRRLFNTHMLL